MAPKHLPRKSSQQKASTKPISHVSYISKIMWIPKVNKRFPQSIHSCIPQRFVHLHIRKGSDYEREGSHPQECRGHELADKHVAVGYRDLVNAAPRCMETGSAHEGAGCYTRLSETFHSCQGEKGMAETRGLAPPKAS